MEQRPERYPQLTCPPPQWRAEPTPTEVTEARAAPSAVVPATTVAGWAYIDRENRAKSSALTCHALHNSG
jgi:hypothetical protein